MKEYKVSIDSMIIVEAENEEQIHEQALEALGQMVRDRQVDFVIESDENDFI